MCRVKTGGELTSAVTHRNRIMFGPIDVHCLVGFATDTWLRTQVIGRREVEIISIPKGSVITGMVIGVPNNDIENNSFEEPPGNIFTGCSAFKENVQHIRVRRIPGSEKITEPQHCQR